MEINFVMDVFIHFIYFLRTKFNQANSSWNCKCHNFCSKLNDINTMRIKSLKLSMLLFCIQNIINNLSNNYKNYYKYCMISIVKILGKTINQNVLLWIALIISEWLTSGMIQLFFSLFLWGTITVKSAVTYF